MIDAFTKACWGLVVCFNLLFLNTVTPPVFSIQGGKGMASPPGGQGQSKVDRLDVQLSNSSFE